MPTIYIKKQIYDALIKLEIDPSGFANALLSQRLNLDSDEMKFLEELGKKTIEFVQEYNPNAKSWRKHHNIGGTEGNLWNPRAIPPTNVYTDMNPSIGGFRVPVGTGFCFYGFIYVGIKIGSNASYRILINGVEVLEWQFDSVEGYHRADDHGGKLRITIFSEDAKKIAFAKENDIVQFQLKATNRIPKETVEIVTLALIAGSSSQLQGS